MMVVQSKENIHRTVKRLHDYVERGDVIECEKLIKEHSVDLDTPLGKEKFTALHKACYYGHIECIHWLVWHTADINAKSIQGWTAAHIAAIRGKDQCFEALMSHKADITLQDEGGQCPAHLAASHGNTFTLRTICRKGGDVDIRDINGWKPVHHAAHKGKLGCVQMLLKWGCHPDTVTLVTGDTPLHLAAAQGHLNVVKYIISCVEDWTRALASINNDAETPLEKSLVQGQHEVVDYLSNLQTNEVEEAEEGFPVHVAATKGDLPALKRMIGSGLYEVNARDDHQSTPAHKAAGYGQGDALKWLLENGADGSLVNSSGENVKDVAKRFGKTECVEELGGYTDDEDGETSPEELLVRALNKVDILEEELKGAKFAVEHLGGTLPDQNLPDRNTVLSEAQELREILEHERIKRERVEATVAILEQQIDELRQEKQAEPTVSPNIASREEISSDEASLCTSSSQSSKASKPSNKHKKKKIKNSKKPLTRGVFIRTEVANANSDG